MPAIIGIGEGEIAQSILLATFRRDFEIEARAGDTGVPGEDGDGRGLIAIEGEERLVEFDRGFWIDGVARIGPRHDHGPNRARFFDAYRHPVGALPGARRTYGYRRSLSRVIGRSRTRTPVAW